MTDMKKFIVFSSMASFKPVAFFSVHTLGNLFYLSAGMQKTISIFYDISWNSTIDNTSLPSNNVDLS